MNPDGPENAFDAAKQCVREELLRRRGYALRKRASLEMELERCNTWQSIYHEGELLQANLYLVTPGMTEVSVADWEHGGAARTIALDPSKKAHEQAAALFRQSKKMRAGISHAEAKLVETEAQIGELDAAEKRLESLHTLQELREAFPPKLAEPTKEEKKALPYHEFRNREGDLIWVGKNARCNDKLTFHHANGSDWWLHVSGYPGSHVVIRMGSRAEPHPETLRDALQLALFYSKAKEHGEGEVVVTQRKYVSRLGKNAPGKVQLSRHKTLFIRADKERLHALHKL